MKAIFIAAGEGSRMGILTENIPKPLLDVNGSSILERQIKLLNKCGIDEIIVITGPFSEKYQFNNIKYINDKKFKEHDQLESLFVASKEIQGDVLLIFADIIFDESILKQILKNESEISIAIDMNWEKYNARTDNTIDDADKISVLNSNAKKIFKNMKFYTKEYEIGEFIGLIKLNNEGSKKINQVYASLVNFHQGKFHDAESFKKSKMIDILQEIIERGIKIEVESITGKWCEIDTIQDLEIAKKIFVN
tara:strand:+ start:270 stop:1019 length:750 start_codon:yes stop_codon:yes gene_type:complete